MKVLINFNAQLGAVRRPGGMPITNSSNKLPYFHRWTEFLLIKWLKRNQLKLKYQEIFHISESILSSLSCAWLFVTPMDYTVHGILHARILEWVALPFSRGPSQPRDWTQVSRIADGFLTSWARREAWDREWIVQIVCLCQSCEFHSLTHPKASKENLKENRLQQLKAPAK